MSDGQPIEVEYRSLEPLGLPGYRVGSDGTIWSCFRRIGFGYGGGTRVVVGGPWKLLKPRGNNQSGHMLICVAGRTRSVHRLILEAFTGPCPPGMQGCHNDGDPTNNRLDNLRWDTPQANYADAVRHGRNSQGERHGNALLTVEKVREIRTRHASMRGSRKKLPNGSLRQLARDFGVSVPAVSAIITRRRWKHC